MARTDLNDYVYFAEVVAHGGFAAAGRALREPKSKLSRRIAGLEAMLGVRLIERSSRRFRVTEIGQTFYERCRAMIAEAEQAAALVAEAQAEPHGRVRFACPTGLVEVVNATLPAFLARYPRVRLQLIAIDRAVDLIEERIDLALRVRTALTSDAALTMRTLGRSARILVASPQMANRIGGTIANLAHHPTLGTSDDIGEIEWWLEQEDGTTHRLRHEPRMTCGDFAAVRQAAIADLGIALLPDHVCADALRSGQLVRLLPDWRAQPGIVHLVFTTRRGLPPAVRALIDHLAAYFPKEVKVASAGSSKPGE
ncbi:LysR family transcriptional regulator [Sphingomonas abietis]|uniref:LysR family transcriptional regulator n=1 Tax=Sphingomonas abietis TaxID=3012344 RepID=A0ABY7NJL3_9SPHN|nr:LysR family transcriptional regulator [Sphingomonas abietis]WBO21730.1 LysR family transcriptional regulator [Sphingomonas abietis]